MINEEWPIDQPEAIYAYAYQFYANGHFEEARSLFSLLTVMQPDQLNYWMGLGACLQMQKKYEKALEAYAAAALIDVDSLNPLPHFYAAECLLSLKDVTRALQALESAHTIAIKDETYEQLIVHINLIKQAWKEPEVSNGSHKSYK